MKEMVLLRFLRLLVRVYLQMRVVHVLGNGLEMGLKKKKKTRLYTHLIGILQNELMGIQILMHLLVLLN